MYLTITPGSLPLTAKPVLGIAQTIGLCAIYLILSTGVVSGLSSVKHFDIAPIDLSTTGLIQQAIAWPITIWIALRWAGTSFPQACPLRLVSARVVPALVLASFGATILLNEAVSWLPMPDAVAKILSEQRTEGSKPILFLSVVIVAPLAEELFWRGPVLRGYLTHYTTMKAAYASAFLFAAIHLNPWQAAAALPAGLALAWLSLRTDSLLPGILCHAMMNFTHNFLLIPLAAVCGYNAEQWMALSHLPSSMLAVGVAATLIGGLLMARHFQDAKLAPVVLRQDHA